MTMLVVLLVAALVLWWRAHAPAPVAPRLAGLIRVETTDPDARLAPAPGCSPSRLERARPLRGRVIVRGARLLTAAATGAGSTMRRHARRPPDAELDRRAGGAALAGVLGLVAGGPAAGAVLVALWWFVPVLAARARSRRAAAALVAEVPEVVDLFRVAASAGLNVRWSVDAVARHGQGPIADAVAHVARRAERGDRLADALGDLALLGEPARPLLEALLASERYGSPMLPALERAADVARQHRRRGREEAARRVPVKLLFPLVFCTLPALGLLTIVPVIVRSWPALVP